MITSERLSFSAAEKRALASFPALPDSIDQIQSYFPNLDTYLNDHFGFRDLLIYRYQREVRKHFAITGDETDVLQGVDGWLYRGPMEVILDFTGKSPLSNTELEKWKSSYIEKKNWLNDKEIQYLLVVVPGKHSVYPEYLKSSLSGLQGTSRLRQIINSFPEINDTELLDLVSVLNDHKEEDFLYFKSDTHWTPYGAYSAYLKIISKLQEFFPDNNFKTDFRFSPPIARKCISNTSNCGDLTTMLLDFDPFEESFKRLVNPDKCSQGKPFQYLLSNLPLEESRPSLIRNCKSSRLKALVFRDSFFYQLEPYFSENFREVVYLWKKYDKNNIEEILTKYKPDIVIEEIVEREFTSDI